MILEAHFVKILVIKRLFYFKAHEEERFVIKPLFAAKNFNASKNNCYNYKCTTPQGKTQIEGNQKPFKSKAALLQPTRNGNKMD